MATRKKSSTSAKRERLDSKAQKRRSKRAKSQSDEEASHSGSEAPDPGAEDYASMLKAMEKENKVLKAHNSALESAAKGSKSDGLSTAAAVRTVVINTTRQVVFPRTAFVCDKTIKEVTRKVMDSIDIAEHQGLEGEDLVKAEANWVDAHTDTVRIAYNVYRNYHQQRCKELWTSTNNVNHDLDMPTPEEVELVAKRLGMSEKDPDPERMRAVFAWYWDKLLPIISSHKRWSPAKRHYNCISTARPNNDPKAMLYVTPSDEAYAVVVWENYAPHWAWKAEIKARNQAAKAKKRAAKDNNQDPKDNNQDPKDNNQEDALMVEGPTDKDKEDSRSKPAYTTPEGGVAEYGGWSKDGRKRYRALLKEIKATKGDPYSKKKAERQQFDYVKALEKEALKGIQQANNVKVNGRGSKRNPAANKDDEVDSDHEIDWD